MLNKICVVGYKGYIGSEVFFRLKLMGFNPIGIDKNNKFKESDITIHLASNIFGKKDTDFLPEIELTKKIIAKTKKKIVFTSSAAVYGNCDKPCRENQKLIPINDYGKAKLTCEKLIQNCFKGKYSILRLSNVYSKEATHGFISKILSGKNIIYGNGQRLRDYIHLYDVVKVIIEAVLTDKWNGIYNIGAGKSVSSLDIFSRLSTKNVRFEQKEEIEKSFFNINKAKKNGFSPFTF